MAVSKLNYRQISSYGSYGSIRGEREGEGEAEDPLALPSGRSANVSVRESCHGVTVTCGGHWIDSAGSSRVGWRECEVTGIADSSRVSKDNGVEIP